LLKLDNVYKKFGDNEVLKGINLEIKEGEVVSIIGPSGTGKSTLLRCINCLEKVDSGNIIIDNNRFDLASLKKEEVLWLRRNTSMVFQGFHLFNNKTAFDNINIGLNVVKKINKNESEKKALEILEQIGLLEKKDKYPGRALALEPKIILFDEPTSALDPELVNEVLLIIEQLARQKITMLIVTHEINFARNVSDKVCFMFDGKIIEQGSAQSVIDNPKHDRTRHFLNKLQKNNKN